MLKPELSRAIVDCGFEHPSEVQHECIPQAGIRFGSSASKSKYPFNMKYCI